jgi:signal transduction histidine kinase
MTRLLNDVLILDKAEADKLKLNPVPLDLEKFCHNLVEELQLNDNSQHTITLAFDWGLDMEKGRVRKWKGETEALVQAGEQENFLSQSQQDKSSLTPSPSHSYMDEKLLGQILENLLSNAIKYSPIGSTIEFTISSLENQAVFTIRDRGIGIPTEDQPRLFETFHRSTNVGTIAGTGLGLAIVKKCVDIHQGQIAVESEIGVGTTFTVTLPIYNLEQLGSNS